MPVNRPLWAIGGYIGVSYGSTYFANSTIKRLLSVVLLVAGMKMTATA